MNVKQDVRTVTLLPNGKVLTTGAFDCELYDPNTGNWTTTGIISDRISQPIKTILLPTGYVLGTDILTQNGDTTGDASLYNPSTGTWSYTGSMNVVRTGHTATLLPNGQVLVVGGENFIGGIHNILASAELYGVPTPGYSSSSSTGSSEQSSTGSNTGSSSTGSSEQSSTSSDPGTNDGMPVTEYGGIGTILMFTGLGLL